MTTTIATRSKSHYYFLLLTRILIMKSAERSLSVGSLEAEGLEFHPNIGRRINHRISIEMELSNTQMNRANTAHSFY